MQNEPWSRISYWFLCILNWLSVDSLQASLPSIATWAPQPIPPLLNHYTRAFASHALHHMHHNISIHIRATTQLKIYIMQSTLPTKHLPSYSSAGTISNYHFHGTVNTNTIINNANTVNFYSSDNDSHRNSNSGIGTHQRSDNHQQQHKEGVGGFKKFKSNGGEDEWRSASYFSIRIGGMRILITCQ